MDSGSAPEINLTRLEDKPGSNPCSDNEKDIQDQSGKPFKPLLTFCKSGGNMKGDSSVGKTEKNTQSLGVEQRYSSGEVVGDEERPNKSLAALFSIQQMDHKDSVSSSSSSSSSSSGHLIVPAGGSMSFRSNSTTSTRSFAFPILASDWNGSPMRMADGDRTRRFSRKRRQWRLCFGCYNV